MNLPGRRGPEVRACGSPNPPPKKSPLDVPRLAAAPQPLAVAHRARFREPGDLCPAQGARYVRAPREAQCRTRFARHGVGTPATGTELLVLARLRRESRERQVANEPAANPRCADRAAVKLRSGGNDAQAKSYRWRSAVILGLVLSGAALLVARAVELQLLDHGFLAKQGDDRSMRVVKIAAHRGAITDRNGEPLAVSTPVDSVWVNPQELNDNIDQLPKLAKALKEDQQWLARRITTNLARGFLYLVRHNPPHQAAH